MNNMSNLETYFAELIQCAGTVYLTISVLLALMKTEKSTIYRPYRIAKWMLTGAFASMALNLFLWCLFTNKNWEEFNYYIGMTDIVLFYLEYMLVCNGFCVLLNKEYVQGKRIKIDLICWAVTSLIAISSLSASMQQYRPYIISLALIMLTTYIACFTVRFYKLYNHYKQQLANYFSDDMHRFARWIARSVVLCVISWLVAIMSMFGNVYFNWLYQFYVISLNIYIAVSFINFHKRYADLAKADTEYAYIGENEKKEEEVNTQQKNTLAKRIDVWLDTRSYLSEQFTLEDLAASIGTNKNYLSFYINERYGMNFSSWISKMRIDEAKRLMTSCPEWKMEEIAYSVGFSSASYFSKVFSFHESMSPTRWKKENIA